MYLKATVILSLLPLLNSQFIHFPTEQENETFPAGVNWAALRGTPEYGVYIEQIISAGNTKLALAVNKYLLQAGKGNDCIVFSPLSVTVALALVLLGAKGKTFEEVSNVMGLAADSNQQVSVASAVFVQKDYPIRSLYKQTAENIYQSEVLNVDFKNAVIKATQLMNDWVSRRTKGKITSLLADPPIAATKNAPATMEVEMMANGGFFPYYKDPNLKCEILGLPYKGNATTMYIILPSNSNSARLKEFQSSLTQEIVDRLADSTVSTGVVMLFPKMKLEDTTDLKDVLMSLGLQSLFNPNEANLALLSPGEAMSDAPARARYHAAEDNPIIPEHDRRNVLVFSRSGFPLNCSDIFNKNSSQSMCETTDGTKKVLYKKFGDKIGRRVAKRDTMDALRKLVDEQSSENFQNPGLYADQVVHKVYMDITETGTEAAASTAVSLSRDGSRITFRVEVPFLFFIRHESTKTILFWGSVTEPTPSFPRNRLADSTVSTGVVMLFPKMKLEDTTDLKDVLMSLGLQSLFNPNEANLALLSPGEPMSDAPARARYHAAEDNPITPEHDRRNVLVFSRSGFPLNCSDIFNKNSSQSMCETTDGTKKVLYKKFGDKIGRRVAKRDTMDAVRKLVDEQSSENFQNSGLYADQVVHKVYIDITETGTEAAASTAVSLSRDGSRITFRVEVPFLFFIRHESTKTILFWGSVTEPTPSFPRNRLADSTVSTGVVMLFPKMKLEDTTDLKDVLMSLGLQSLFNPNEANLALLSPGEPMSDAPARARYHAAEDNPITPEHDRRNVLVFSRSGFPLNCSEIFNKNSSQSMCETTDGTKKVLYKKFGDKIGRRVAKRDTMDAVRKLVDEQSSENFQNPGLYADQVVHKVYMDITETGTEAAASTAVSLSRDGSRITFRVEVPFLFFIRHESTKTILFWGSVTEPTPSFPRR
nr:unnamed protein product [Callosobruchus analis]